jgi:hypothetical protein
VIAKLLAAGESARSDLLSDVLGREVAPSPPVYEAKKLTAMSCQQGPYSIGGGASSLRP